MQSNALQDLDTIDAAMASVGTGGFLGIDVSPTRLGTHARMSNAMKKRQKHEPIKSEVSGMIEPFESRMLPSTLLHPLTDSSFAMTLKNGASMSDGTFQTNGGTTEIADNDTLDFGSGDFTISASVQFQRNNEIEMILFKIARGANTQGYGLRKMNDNTIQGLLCDGKGNFLALNSIGKITDTTGFHEISMVRKGDILGLWIDGVEQQTKIIEGAQGHYDISNPAPLIVGRTDDGYYQLEAKIKDLKMTKGAFTPAEIAELQKAASSPVVSQETVESFQGNTLSTKSAIDPRLGFDPVHHPSMVLRNDAKLSSSGEETKLILTGNGYAEIPEQDGIDFGTEDFTISTSVRFQRSGQIEMIVGNMVGGPTWQGYFLRRHPDGTLEFGQAQDFTNNKMHVVQTTETFNDSNHTYDITANRSGASLQIFVDGREILTKLKQGTAVAYNVSNGSPTVIGGISYDDVYRLKGEIHALTLRKGAFTPEQIAELLAVQEAEEKSNSTAVSQEVAYTTTEASTAQQIKVSRIETYTEPEFISFSSVPNGLYAPGQFHTVNLTPEIKIRLYSDNMFEVDNGTIVPTGSGNDWIHVSLAEGQSPIPVSSVRVRYNPYGGGAAGTLNVLSEDDQNRVMKLSQEGDIPVVGPVKRVLYTLEGHKGALLGMTLDVTKTREVAVPVTEEPAESVEGISQETITTIAEIVASQEQKITVETSTANLVHPLTDSSFSMTLKNGASMSDGTFQTNGGTTEIADNDTLDFGSGDFTVSASVQFQRNNEIEMILFKIARGANTQGYGLRKMNDNTIQGLLCDGKGNFLALNSIGKITDTTGFHDISMVRKGDILGLWIDGVEQETKIIEGAQGHYDISNPAPLIVGRTDDGYYQLEAKIKELILTEGAFTPAEMAEMQKAQSSSLVSQETVKAIAETVISQKAESVMGPEASETIDEHAPLLRVVGIQGSNITLAVSSPMTGGNSVRFTNLQDDGLFTGSVIQGVTDGSVTPVSLGMNAVNGTGNYRIVLAGGPNGSTLASVEVHWDRDSKKLSLAGNEKLWECSEQIGKVMNAQTQEVLALAKNPMVGSGVLQAMQQESLIDGVRALPSSGLSIPEFESAFWAAHPEWKDDAIHETAIRESKTTRYTATQIFNRIVMQRNDTMGILRGAYSRYYSILGELLQKAVTVLSEVRSGGHEPDIRRNFAILVDRYATSLPMYQLFSIGIRIPDGNTLLEAVKSVWTTRCEELIKISSETARLQAAEVYQDGLIAKGFIELSDGQKVAADDPRASTKLVFFLDEMNRPTLRPQGEVAIQGGVETYAIQKSDGQPQIIANEKFKWMGNGYDLIKESEIPTSKNTMIVVIYGSNQFPNQQAEAQKTLPGFDKLVTSLQENYQEVWPLMSGENPGDHIIRGIMPNMHIEARSSLINNEAFISTRVRSNPLLQYIVLVGYSWGGGDVYEVANWVTNQSGLKIKIAASVYVDAITLKSSTEENRFPPGSQSMLNIFQSNQWDSTLFLGGGHITDSKEIEPVEINLDQEQNTANHDNIDEISYQKVLEFIHQKIIVQQ